jgi:hypothetical protein
MVKNRTDNRTGGGTEFYHLSVSAYNIKEKNAEDIIRSS